MRPGNKRQALILAALGLIPVIWLGLIIAPSFAGGQGLASSLPSILQTLTAALNNPFHVAWGEDSFKTVLIFIAAYGMGIGIYLSTRRNYRRREEHGSAKWGDAAAVCKRYRDIPFLNNKILTQHVRMGFNVRRHKRNLNVLICGGSGAGKTRAYAKPNVMQCNTSMVILDPKGVRPDRM